MMFSGSALDQVVAVAVSAVNEPDVNGHQSLVIQFSVLP